MAAPESSSAANVAVPQASTGSGLPGNASTPNTADILASEKARKLEAKKVSFDREFRYFVKQAQETITSRYGTNIELGDIRQELVCLNRYLSIYNNTAPEEHHKYFETIFNRKRTEILNSLNDDRWLRTGKLVIQYGDGIKSTKEIEEKRKQVRIMLSDIFLIACDLQELAEKRLDNIDDKFRAESGGKDLIRPTILLLHLMRIFYFLTDTADKLAIGKIVTQLEEDLQTSQRTVAADVTPTAAQMAQNPAAAGGLSGLFTMATSMMEKMGYKPPPGMKAPSEGEISTVIGNVFNNQTTQNAISGMFSSLKDCNDFGTAVQTVVKQVTDPTTMAAIQSSVAETAANTLNGGAGVSNPPAPTTESSSAADAAAI